MTLLFRKCHNRFQAGKRELSFFLPGEVRRKIFLAVCVAIILAPSFVESPPLFAAEIKPKLVDGDVVFLECRLQDGNTEHHVQGLIEFGDLRCKRLSQLHTRETTGVQIGKAEGKIVGNPRPNERAEKSEYRFFHDDPAIDGTIGGIVGLIIGAVLIMLVCRYVWFRDESI